MTTIQVIETSVTNNSLSEDCSHPDDHTSETPGFKPFTCTYNDDDYNKLVVASREVIVSDIV